MTLTDKLALILTVTATLGSGLIGGSFFAFSTSVMKALGKLPANEGMAAMQQINVVILNPVFLGVFMGTALVSAVVAVLGFVRFGRPGLAWLIAGALFYIVGSLLVTIAFNVPMNNTLAAADAASPEGQEIWKNYLVNWTFWNHVRTIASLLASASFIPGLYFSR
jgi:uncharacterized membrane protein